MKRILILSVILGLKVLSFAQQKTFDLITYTAPKGWSKEEKENVIAYARVDQKTKKWCQIGVYKSTISKGTIEDDLQSEWNELAAKPLDIRDSLEATETQEADGWKIKSASGKFTFNNQPSAVILTTFSGFGRCVSIVATTNSQLYFDSIQAFIATIDLKKPESNEQNTNTGNAAIIGNWGKSNKVSQLNNRFGNYSYNKQQYSFNSNGTYAFNAKTYDEKDAETLLIIEDGNFTIDGNTITVTPKNSVIEAWTKKNGGDNWNKLKARQKRRLENVTYQFNIENNNLLLTTSKQTERDGRFNEGNTYTYGPPGTFTPIQLPVDNQIVKEPEQQTIQAANPQTNSGYAFSTTNFDDGWTSTVQEDWVEVAKGDAKLLLHYPKEGTIFPADPEAMTNAAWNILVAPRYSNLTNYKTSYIATFDRPYLGMGYATENATGKNVFIFIFHQGYSGWLEYVGPDKNSFIQNFNFDPDAIQWDSNEKLLNPLADMFDRNKFAISLSDFTGKWTSDFTGIQQLYSVYTGQYAGMSINQSSQEFIFNSDHSYNWRLLAVNGMIGNVKAVQVKSTGKLTVLNNWQIHCSDIEGSAKTYHAFWSCIKGARILFLLDANRPGSGVYSRYGLAK